LLLLRFAAAALQLQSLPISAAMLGWRLQFAAGVFFEWLAGAAAEPRPALLLVFSLAARD